MLNAAKQNISKSDIDELVSGATPHFSQQLIERIKHIAQQLPEQSDVREYCELQIHVLQRIATGTTRGTLAIGVPSKDDDGWESIPSHPAGGIAGGYTEAGH